MIILARSPVLYENYQSRLKGYETGWFLLQKLDYKITCEPHVPRSEDDGDASPGSEMTLGGGKFETLKITKVVNGATPFLMHRTCQGSRIPSLEVQVVETRDLGPGQGSNEGHQVQNYPVLLLRFESLWLTSWDIEIEVGSLVEKVELRYRKVACMYRNRDLRSFDGINYSTMGSKGWSIEDDRGKDSTGADWDYQFKIRGDV